MLKPRYHRVLLKLSGEALTGSRRLALIRPLCRKIADEIKEIHEAGVELGIVIGGGNIFRGASARGMDRGAADCVGMLATAINSIVISEGLGQRGVQAKVLSAVAMPKIAEFFTASLAREHLRHKKVVIIAGGTGNPYFTTDTAAALRCLEIEAEVILKATKVDGVYDSDPMKNPKAVKFASITHAEALQKNLKIMDATAFSAVHGSQCDDNSL